jgi:putative tricarboxylic transport membrane protein
MIEAAIQGTLNAFSLSVLPFVIGGVLIGLIFGIIPAIGATAAMAIVLPLTYTMTPEAGLALLMAIHAVGCTGGSITAILINIPGTPLNAATMIDGFPMAQQGQAGRAIAAALTASGLGGLFGGLVFLSLIPVSRTIVMAFGSPEAFLTALVGLAFLSVLSKGSTVKGLASGLVGILLSFVGLKGMTTLPRFTFGTLALYDGIPLIPLIIGLFALPEVIDLAVRGKPIAKIDKAALAAVSERKQVVEGMRDIFRHWKTFLTGSIIGTVIGIIPGIGGQTATFVAYAQAKQISKHPERFGKGYVEGVIAPEAANNSKEGGSMVPTLAFGIPGSAMMAIILAGFLAHGIIPGPGVLKDHLDLTFTLLATLIFANIIGVLFLLPVIGKISKICFVPGSIMAPLILVIAAFGGYAADGSYLGMLMTFIFGGLGFAMVRFGFDRICLLLGFILGIMVEQYLYVSVSTSGISFLLYPIPLILELIFILVLTFDLLKSTISKRRKVV